MSEIDQSAAPKIEPISLSDRERELIETLRSLQSNKKQGTILLKFDGESLVQVLEAKPIKALRLQT